MKAQIKSTSLLDKAKSFIANYLLRHAQVCISSLGRMCRSPFASLITTMVIGIALALPAGLYIVLENFQTVTAGWDGGAQISLFMESNATEKDVRQLQKELNDRPSIDKVSYISREEALEEFKLLSGFGQALDALDHNPLPAVIVLKPSIENSSPEQLNNLVQELNRLPLVQLAQLDMQWIKRLYSILEIVRRGVWVIATLLGLAVLLVVGNTIRLDIENRRDEIVITKLIGATNAFIRRPFLYTGFWYGVTSGLIALILVGLSLSIIEGPIKHLSALYQSQFTPQGLGIGGSTILLLAGALLGLIGSWFSVGRHLGAIEPK